MARGRGAALDHHQPLPPSHPGGATRPTAGHPSDARRAPGARGIGPGSAVSGRPTSRGCARPPTGRDERSPSRPNPARDSLRRLHVGGLVPSSTRRVGRLARHRSRPIDRPAAIVRAPRLGALGRARAPAGSRPLVGGARSPSCSRANRCGVGRQPRGRVHGSRHAPARPSGLHRNRPSCVRPASRPGRPGAAAALCRRWSVVRDPADRRTLGRPGRFRGASELALTPSESFV